MSIPTQEKPGQRLVGLLRDSLRAFRIGPVGGGRSRPMVYNVTDKGTCVGDMTIDGFLDRASEILLETGRIYRFGNSIVLDTGGPDDPHLTTLAVQGRPEPHATSVLANFFAIGVEHEQSVTQSLVPAKLIGAILANEDLWCRLPEIKHYSRRPCCDGDFQPCQPGWNPGSGNLVHGPEIIPAPFTPPTGPGAKAIDRLPTHLKALLSEFDWRSNSDPVNTVGMLLTGFLINHFIDDPHPAGIVDANQSQVGKTLLVQSIGRILDDAEPPRTALVRDDELEKKLCAQLRSSRTSLFFLDNIRAKIESMVLEQNMLSPLLSFRILGRSATVERPNTYLWFITSNLTAGTTDLISRGVPIRLYYEGAPKERRFRGKPLAYAGRHRLEILGELAGMVLRWVQQGRPLGHHEHRCDRWAAVIGGILDANGLGEWFLANVEEAEMAMDQGLLDLVTLAEHVVSKGLTDFFVPADGNPAAKGKPSGLWAPVVSETQVLRDNLAECNAKGKATAVGIFLGGKLNRRVAIETADGPRMATLRKREAGAGQKFYFFELATDAGHAGALSSPAGAPDPAAPDDGGAARALIAPLAADEGLALAGSPLPWANAAPNGNNNPPVAGDPEWF